MYELKININNCSKLLKKTKKTKIKTLLNELLKRGTEPEEYDKNEKNRRKILKELAVELDKEIVKYNEENIIFEILDMNDNEIIFTYGDSSKKVFLSNLSELWETESSLNYAYRVLDWVEEVESISNKPIYMANKNEVTDIIPVVFNDTSYYGMRFRVKVFMEIQLFLEEFIKVELNSLGWEIYFKSDRFRNIFLVDEPITKEELLKLFNISKNAQNGIIPLLIFEGLTFSRIEEKDEIRYLKELNIKNNEIKIEKEDNNSRIIHIDNEIRHAISNVIHEKYILQNRFGHEDIKMLNKSEYLLKVAKNNGTNNNILTYRGAYSRLSHCFDTYQINISHKTINPKIIKLSGQYHYINKYISEGFTQQEAMRRTLKRFGEWVFLKDVKKEPSHMSNRQKMNRLKKKWEVYNNSMSLS
ncbi:hypothetical protein [Vagococcus luciliae]|uniref:Tyr recombinase domain-containing protein n=1 Tax=Vagococcus luciliae TaxID=2920380 RepID=A0ABY5P0C7_9ENTE|nr:hypothetical protein [Vagococcus luciliae]UUV99374.1 hypothetical protein G314FT_15350 [Vagococcus luciliae]